MKKYWIQKSTLGAVAGWQVRYGVPDSSHRLVCMVPEIFDDPPDFAKQTAESIAALLEAYGSPHSATVQGVL